MTTDFDIFIIGGGINGCGIARDASGRGYRVGLAEMNDLASGTSSWSTKIIHGGLRYLEHFEFRLVREALIEREILWRLAPHIIRPLRFVLPHQKGGRPYWLIRLGLYLYDYMGGRQNLPYTRSVDLRKHITGHALKDSNTRALIFSDCRVDDSRLVILNAKSAAEKGAQIFTRARVIKAQRQNEYWEITLEHTNTGAIQTYTANILINAGGPWADIISNDAMDKVVSPHLRLVQGSHIIVRKKFDHAYAYFFQNNDKRIFFAIPYHGDFTLIGTTDTEFSGDPYGAKITEEEINYLCKGASDYFETPVTQDDIVWHFSGVRALYNDGASQAQEATRDYVIDTCGTEKDALLITIFGGKITTYRCLAEEIMRIIGRTKNKNSYVRDTSWTDKEALPGGNFPMKSLDQFIDTMQSTYPSLSPPHITRLATTYGTEAYDILHNIQSVEELGQHFGHTLYEREVTYLIQHEFAQDADDILWRRTKLGLYFSPEEANTLDQWINAYKGI